MPKVTIVQFRLLHYRVRLFELLRERLHERGIEMVLVCGQASETERLRNDVGHLDWAFSVRNRFLRVGGVDLVWQPMPPGARNADLVVVVQENRILSNYLLQLARRFGGTRLAFWGHGRNYQSRKPGGLRERWKTWWLRQVDWWFGYTEGTRDYLVQKGFPADRITVLDNAIDGEGFGQDLAGITTDEIRTISGQLGIGTKSQVAIYCGSIYAEKRIGLLLESADLLRARLPDFHLLVVGDGPDAALVKRAAESRRWLHFVGQQKGRGKALYYRLAQVMLNPGLVGLHVVDAFVAGTPLVTQSSAMHSPEYDYLIDGENGRSVRDDSVQAYALAVTEMFENADLLARMRANCERDARRYTVDNMASNFAAGIVEFMRRQRAQPRDAGGTG